ncbi:Thiol-disulfide isomerase or thioredoxin [Bryocella elongata]|uniref:Thiol-disulfide isomerase or thioredoxin n=1 Tax=Bryocella elongata TaxID=863522 RepID=A0A1H6AAD9_9BACT|nr:TlpA disulfide reductase family protein [Bryocella elongata]SEG45164.1 Thiol-disulfide isomerase or thioredoxin [Bryocella elongata]
MKVALLTAALLSSAAMIAGAQATPDSITKEIRGLRALPEAERGPRTGAIAREIAALPAGKPKLSLAVGLAHLSTEGDPGHDNLQAVTDALSSALAEAPVPESAPGKPAEPYHELAELARYEGMHVGGPATQDTQYDAAMKGLEHEDDDVAKADFTLKDGKGKKWTMSELRGKIVLLNFWATWCPPCRVELPNLDVIAEHYASQGLVVLSVTDEDEMKVFNLLHGSFNHINVIYDPGRKTEDRYHVNSLPRTYVFTREGKLAAVGMDGRTQRQFLLMLQKAGLKL